jgi:hypothetical protein
MLMIKSDQENDRTLSGKIRAAKPMLCKRVPFAVAD